jgi:signal peptidase I
MANLGKDDRPAGSPRRRWVRWRWVLLLLAVGVGVPMLLQAVTRAASMRAYVIPTSSMAPTLAPGDRFVVDEGRRSDPKRGEIWALRMPSPPAPRGSIAVKRVVGLPGETIEVASGRVLIDGEPLSEPYLTAPPSYTLPPTKLGPREYFVLGDNRNVSSDSHVWGPLDASGLMGPVRYRFWPPQRAGGP